MDTPRFTKEQLMQRGAIPYQNESTDVPRFTAEQLQQRGATMYNNQGDVNGKNVKFKNKYDEIRFNELNDTYSKMNQEGGLGGDTPLQQFASKAYFAPESKEEIGGINKFSMGAGKQLVKTGFKWGDFGLTALNFLSGNQLFEDPAMQFGTASRKLKYGKLYKAQDAGQKAGSVLGTAAEIALTDGLSKAVAAPIEANTAVQAAKYTANNPLVRFGARVAPNVVGNVAQGIAINAGEGKEITPGNIAIDATLAATPELLFKTAKSLGIFGQTAKNGMLKKEVEQVAEYARSNPEAWEAIQKQVDTKLDSAGKAFSEISDLKGPLKQLDNLDDVIQKNPEYFEGKDAGTVLGRQIIEANKNFDVTKITRDGKNTVSSLTKGVEDYNQKIYDNLRTIGKQVNQDIDFGSLSNRINEEIINSGRKISDSTAAQKALMDFTGKGNTFEALLNVALEPLNKLSKDIGDTQSAYILKKAVTDELYSILERESPEAAVFFREYIREAQLNAIAIQWLNKVNQSVHSPSGFVGRFLGSKLSSEIAGILASGGHFSPVRYIVGKNVGAKLFDVGTNLQTKANIQNPALFGTAKELGMVNSKQNELLNRSGVIQDNLGNLSRGEKETVVTRLKGKLKRKDINKARGSAKAKKIAQEREAYIPEDKLPVIDYGKGKLKRSNLPTIR